MEHTTFQIAPIPAEEAAELRRQGGEVYVADAVPGYPCRQCLRDAEVGEELLLVAYDPFTSTSTSPYRSRSPIFIHRTDCGPPEGAGAVPLQLSRRQLSVRSFDSNEMMIDAAVVDGAELEQTLERFLACDDAELIHIHNAGRGCWAAWATRPGAPATRA